MFVKFEQIDYEKFPKRLEELLNRQRVEIDKITNSKDNSYNTTLKLMQDLDEELNLFFTPLSHLNSVMNSSETQKAYEQSIPLLSKFSSEMSQNSQLFHKLEQIEVEDEESSTVLKHELRDFILSGVNLTQDKKDRLEEISLRLSELSNSFSQNLLNSTNEYEMIIDNDEDIEGIPEADLNSAKEQRDGKTIYRFTLQMPSYLAYMTYGANREKRAEISKAYSMRAPKNAKIIDNMLLLKDEKAKILDFDSYAEYALETRDANSTQEVIDFLHTLLDTALAPANKELDEIKKFAYELDGIDEFRGYDMAYYSEKLKRDKFNFDDEITKPYFEQNRVLSGMLEVVSKLFNVQFVEVETEAWHECVKCYDLYQDKQVFARIYFDLEAREEKRGGAWMNDWESHFIDSNTKEHLSSAFIVCNFASSSADNPSLLRHDDVVTLFHEMGHAIHHLFSTCHERSVSGINGVAWDVVEFPSQFLENFAYDESVIKQIGVHYQSQEPIPDELVSKIQKSKNFQAAMGIIRQVEFSLFDFMLHQKLYQGDEIQKLLNSIREKTSILKVEEYNKFQHGFAHIFAGGYAAGYYSYKWAEVLSADAFLSCLDKNGNFDTQYAKEYKKNILQQGSKKSMQELYKRWLNREAKTDSLLKLYGLL